MADKKSVYSGIGGQAVLEGVMMKNKDKYSVAVRKPDGEIEVDIDEYTGISKGNSFKKLPFFRGVFNFIDSIALGMKTLSYSASFYEEGDEAESKFDKALNRITKGNAEKFLTGFTTILSFAIAIAVFILLPYFLTDLLTKNVRNSTFTALVEGAIRIVVFVSYVALISLNKDIKRVYRYHGAEHKCINCLERGKPLTVGNVRRSSKHHRRCGTSFLLFVVFVSIILFFFIRVDSRLLRVVIRIALIPVIAGISYEIIRLNGRFDNTFTRILSAPGMLLQRLTTKNPDDEMIEVAIAAVDAVFDWRDFLKENFGVETFDEDEETSDKEDASDDASKDESEIETVIIIEEQGNDL